MKFVCSENLPILEALAHFFPQSSKSSLRSWLKEGRVSVDGKIIKNSLGNVVKGQSLVIGNKPRLVDDRVPIIYEDDHFVVIDKPNGLLSVSTAFEKTETAFGLLKQKYYPRTVYVTHRLDQDTSGVMLFALSEKGQEGLKKLFERHELTREYIAVVEGNMSQSAGVWKSYLHEDGNYVMRSSQNSNSGELAITHFQVEDSKRSYSLLKLKLETGKKNQIRVHCQDAGHPVAGDKKYGAQTNPLKRLCLHAHLLAFNHPITGKPMKFISEVPSIFYKLV